MQSLERALTRTSSHLGQKAWSPSHRVIAKYASNTSVSVVAFSFSYCKFSVLGKCYHLGKLVISAIYKPELASNTITKNSKGINRKLQVSHQINIRLLERVFAHLITEAFAGLNKELAPTANGKGHTWYNTQAWPKPIGLPVASPAGCKLLLYYFRN